MILSNNLIKAKIFIRLHSLYELVTDSFMTITDGFRLSRYSCTSPDVFFIGYHKGYTYSQLLLYKWIHNVPNSWTSSVKHYCRAQVSWKCFYALLFPIIKHEKWKFLNNGKSCCPITGTLLWCIKQYSKSIWFNF